MRWEPEAFFPVMAVEDVLPHNKQSRGEQSQAVTCEATALVKERKEV